MIGFTSSQIEIRLVVNGNLVHTISFPGIQFITGKVCASQRFLFVKTFLFYLAVLQQTLFYVDIKTRIYWVTQQIVAFQNNPIFDYCTLLMTNENVLFVCHVFKTLTRTVTLVRKVTAFFSPEAPSAIHEKGFCCEF